MRTLEVVQAGLLVLALSSLTHRGLTLGDDAVHVALADAVLTRGETTLELDPGEAWVPSRAAAGGLFFQSDEGLRSASAPGLAALALPFVAAARALAGDGLPAWSAVARPLFLEGGSPRATLRPIQRDARAIAFSVVGPISAALAVVFLLLAARALALSRTATWLSGAALAFGSPLLSYAGTDWTQLPTCAALSFALYRACERERRPGAGSLGLGVALALAVLVRPDHLAFVVPFGLATYQTDRRWRRGVARSMVRALAPVAVAVIALALFGLPESAGGWSPSTLPEGALGLLLSPRTGLLVYAPFVALAPLALPVLRARCPPIGWILYGAPLLAVVLYGGWFDWPASLAYGPRFLVPVLPMLALAFGLALDRTRRGAVIGVALVLLGLLIQLPGALLVHGRIPEPEAFFAPTFVAAWRTLLEGDSVGDLGVDCASTYVLAYPVFALSVCVIGGLVTALWARSTRLAPR